MKDWMNEEYGIPHKNGHVRFYVIGFNEDVFHYLGWYDMTNWDEAWETLWADAQKAVNDDEDIRLLRHDQLIDLKNNVNWALEEALRVEEETTFEWWWKKERLKEKEILKEKNGC
jgi:hypothetical protein